MEQVISFQSLKPEDYEQINSQLAVKDTLDVIRWAYDQFQDELVYACSFGAEGMVLIDLIYRVRKNAKIIFLDTHKHFKETYELIDRVKERYPELRIELREPELSLEEQSIQHGPELWSSNPDLCCQLRKIKPLHQALKGARAWLSGLRREQSSTRAHVQFVNRDAKFESIKICPLIHWSWEDIWTYIRTFELAYNVLHDQGYPSIGCETCTLPVDGEGDSREGRWTRTGKTECGLHT